MVSGDLDTVELLLSSGANVKLVDAEGRTALLTAATTNTTESLATVKLLLKAGADKDVRDKHNKTVYELAKNPKVRRLFRPW